MSDTLAIAAVTAALRKLLEDSVADLPGTEIKTRPPDKALPDNGQSRVNLFLYQTSINAAFTNLPMPGSVRNYEGAYPPLPLNLYYLMTAYSANDDDLKDQELLGRAMQVFHDNRILSRAHIANSLNGIASGLDKQIEQVKISPHAISLDELTKLWTMFQTQYRISTAYQISLVLIETSRASRTPLPVLKRGETETGDEAGVFSQADLIPPVPTLSEIILPENVDKKANDPRKRSSILPTDTILIKGYHLDKAVALNLEHPRLPAALKIVNLEVKDEQTLECDLSNTSTADFVAGLYHLTVELSDNRTTNAIGLSLAPTIAITNADGINANNIATINQAADKSATIKLSIEPPVRRAQRVTLLLGERPITPSTFPVGVDTVTELTFVIPNAEKRVYALRLRVDGVDSLLIDYTKKMSSFREDQKVEVV